MSGRWRRCSITAVRCTTRSASSSSETARCPSRPTTSRHPSLHRSGGPSGLSGATRTGSVRVSGPRITSVASEVTESPLLEGLNPVQKEAVLHTEGPVLIVAGAGSGKTRALTYRIAHLIRDLEVSPYQILAITFTNKAAQEMAERVEGLLGARVATGMWILTFHSACARILRREHTHLGVPSHFSIYDEGDTERVISLVLKGMDVDPKRYAPRAVAAMIGKAKDNLVSPREYGEHAGSFYERVIAEVYA